MVYRTGINRNSIRASGRLGSLSLYLLKYFPPYPNVFTCVFTIGRFCCFSSLCFHVVKRLCALLAERCMLYASLGSLVSCPAIRHVMNGLLRKIFSPACNSSRVESRGVLEWGLKICSAAM